MDKSFEPTLIESKWYAAWEATSNFQPSGHGDPYCILLPPPNVTGTLHMGHAFQQTIMDALIRYHRMRGFNTLWQGGTDHAGIATQKIVENQLAVQGKTRHDLGREKFIERVWEWKKESGSTITNQMRRLGASIDWSRERFTMDEGLSAAVRRVFVQWYRDGLLYRGKRFVHWDPVLQTAVSDLEVNNEERDGFLWSILYPFVDTNLRGANGEQGLIVATTRPETMLGDVAVAVHPEDERYAHLIGKTLCLPLCDRNIPIIADEYVDREFGTACVKVTPEHDRNDYQIWLRNEKTIRAGIDLANEGWPSNWTPFSILSWDGKIASAGNNATLSESHRHGKQFEFGKWPGFFIDQLVPQKYQGRDRFDARKIIVADLKDLVVDTKKHKLQVPISQRSDAIIEPLRTKQWFLDLTTDALPAGRAKAAGSDGGRKLITLPALNAVKNGDIKFVPENWSTTYNQWLENIQDWCVSRQLWWGHRIPAWYDEVGNIFVGENEADALVHSETTPVGALRQDEDVLDTWFSSALWPFSTLGWPSEQPVHEDGKLVANWPQDQAFLPSAVLVTGFDIIFFWVARMVMATQYFTGKVPFREVYINAIVRDAEGQKMSKSKGNTIDPLDLIDGIDLETLVKKSTASLLIPQVREKVEKRIRKEYPNGINAVGADALRFTFAALGTYARTINFDLNRAEGYKNFCNKLWNAARFVLMNCENYIAPTAVSGFIAAEIVPSSIPVVALIGTANTAPHPVTEAEKWILARLHHMLAEVHKQFAAYRFDLLAQAVYEFTWNEFCDWFLEFAKPALQSPTDTDDSAVNAQLQHTANSTRHTLLYTLETLLRTLHPLIPFVTEEIWHEIAPKLGISGETISLQPYPCAEDFAVDAAAESDIQWLKSVLLGIRSIRGEMNISPAKKITLLFANGNASDRLRHEKFAAQIAFLARAEAPRWLAQSESEPASAAALIGDLRVLIPLAGLIDVGAEQARIAREKTRVEGEIKKCQGKLNNASFIDNAPLAVVEQEKQRLTEFSALLVNLIEQLQRLTKL